MALSTYWVSQRRKDLAEQAIVARREKEAARTKKCHDFDSYHKDLALKSTKYNSLENAKTLKTPRVHEESYVQENRIAEEKEKLEFRRQKLANILAAENDQYMKELQELKQNERDKDPWNISKIKAQIEELQRKRRENEQNKQKRYMRHLFSGSENNTKKDSDFLEKEVLEAMQKRQKELEELKLEKEQQERELLLRLESEKLRVTNEAREVEMLHLKEQEKWSNLVQQKVSELHDADIHSQNLKGAKQILTEHLENLLSLQRKRDSVREIHRKVYQKIESMWQAKEKLRRMLNEVKHGLEFDYKLLMTMTDFNSSAAGNTCLDLEAVTEAKAKVEMQLALEKRRELEISQFFHEEAAKEWEKRKEEWLLESIARDEIMNELLKCFANQINNKIELIIKKEETLMERRENCIRDIEGANLEARDVSKTLEEKHEYFIDQATRLEDSLNTVKITKRSTSAK